MRRLIDSIFAVFLACTLLFSAAHATDYVISYELNGGTNYANAPISYTSGTGATIDGIPQPNQTTSLLVGAQTARYKTAQQVRQSQQM